MGGNDTCSWDEAKREKVFRERGIDFDELRRFFLGPDALTVEDKRRDYGEPRYNMLGKHQGLVLNITFPVFGEPAASAEPRKRALHDPSLGQDDKPLRLIGALDDLETDALEDLLERTLELRSLVTGIGVELHQKRVASEQRRQEPHAPIAVLDLGGVHDRVHQQALRVDENVTLLAFDPFTRIVARQVDRGPPFSALFTLWLSMIATVGLASREACSRHVT